jgi:hypothetical protein
MKILVACEESQVVTMELRKLGHEAYSCDILPTSGGFPEWHIQGDVLSILKPSVYDYDGRELIPLNISDGTVLAVEKWDMIIAFPPCTYLSNAGARHLYPKGILNNERYDKGMKAREFFMQIYNADCDKIAIENPISSRIFNMPQFTQYIQPYEYGHPYTKKTRLWLKGLESLKPTNIVKVESNTKLAGNWFNKGGSDRQRNRSKTFPGIAKAMATQFGGTT